MSSARICRTSPHNWASEPLPVPCPRFSLSGSGTGGTKIENTVGPISFAVISTPAGIPPCAISSCSVPMTHRPFRPQPTIRHGAGVARNKISKSAIACQGIFTCFSTHSNQILCNPPTSPAVRHFRAAGNPTTNLVRCLGRKFPAIDGNVTAHCSVSIESDALFCCGYSEWLSHPLRKVWCVKACMYCH